MATVSTVTKLVGSTWTAAQSLAIAKRSGNQGSNARYASKNLSVSGSADGSATLTTCEQQTDASWSTMSAISAKRGRFIGVAANGVFYAHDGFDTITSGFAGTSEKWNGVAWGSATRLFSTNIGSIMGAFVPFFSATFGMGGLATPSSNANTTTKLTLSEVQSAVTGSPSGTQQACCFSSSNKFYAVQGSSDTSASNARATNYSWNETAWSTETAAPAARFSAGGAKYGSNSFMTFGGVDTGGTAQTTTHMFNGVSWSSFQTIPVATSEFQGVGSG